jgi:proton-dependent oligopeptide transporter, POT family
MSQKPQFPRSIPYIIGNEAAERFSFYGMKAILTTFLVSQFFNPTGDPALGDVARARANEETHFFITMAYFTPVLGGLLADWFLGKYRTILYISLFYCLGHACLAMFENNLNGFMFGLMLIAIGAGGIKPCVSANVGDQFDKSNESLITKAFSLFYFSINLGAFFSTLLTPMLMQWYGPKVAFGIPGILMGIATFVFWLGRNKYVKVPPSGYKKENFLAINFYALTKIGKTLTGQGILDAAADKYPAKSIDGVKAVWRVLSVFAFIPIFWAMYDQNGSEWVLQATHEKMDKNFLGITWLAEQVQAINPILILTFIPLFSWVIYPSIEKLGIKVTALRKIGAGLLLTAMSFAIIAYIQFRLDSGITTNIAWQLSAYFVLTAAEVLISITGLEYAYTQAPPTMKSTIMAFYMLTVSLGNYFVSLINKNMAAGGFLSHLHGTNYYLFFISIISVFTLIYFFASRRIVEKSYLPSEMEQQQTK